MIGTAAALLGSAAIGAGASIFGSSKAANAQAKAAADANALLAQQKEQMRTDLEPWRTSGASAAGKLNFLTGNYEGGNPMTAALTKPFTADDLENTPGYQFTLNELTKATQGSAAAKGLGSSGAAIKAAQDRTLGLASTTYQQQLDNYMKQNQSIYNMLMGQSQLGENAAAQTGQQGSSLTTQQANNLTGAGNAQAASYMTSANAISQGVNNAASGYSQNQIINQLLNPNVANTNGIWVGAQGYAGT